MSAPPVAGPRRQPTARRRARGRRTRPAAAGAHRPGRIGVPARAVPPTSTTATPAPNPASAASFAATLGAAQTSRASGSTPAAMTDLRSDRRRREPDGRRLTPTPSRARPSTPALPEDAVHPASWATVSSTDLTAAGAASATARERRLRTADRHRPPRATDRPRGPLRPDPAGVRLRSRRPQQRRRARADPADAGHRGLAGRHRTARIRPSRSKAARATSASCCGSSAATPPMRSPPTTPGPAPSSSTAACPRTPKPSSTSAKVLGYAAAYRQGGPRAEPTRQPAAPSRVPRGDRPKPRRTAGAIA